MFIQKLITLFLLFGLFHTRIIDITPTNFKQVFEKSWHQYQESQSSEARGKHLILFYRSEIESSLDARQLFNDIQKLHASQIQKNYKKHSVTESPKMEEQKIVQYSEIDCNQNEEICQYFNVNKFPSIIYIRKNGKLLIFKGQYNLQQLTQLFTKFQQDELDENIFNEHKPKTKTIISQLRSFLKNQIVMYFLVFLIGPFLFGYFVMGKKGEQKDNINTQKFERLFKQEQKKIQNKKSN